MAHSNTEKQINAINHVIEDIEHKQRTKTKLKEAFFDSVFLLQF